MAQTSKEQAPAEGPEVKPKKHRERVDFNLFNPLGNLSGAKKADEKKAARLVLPTTATPALR